MYSVEKVECVEWTFCRDLVMNNWCYLIHQNDITINKNMTCFNVWSLGISLFFQIFRSIYASYIAGRTRICTWNTKKCDCTRRKRCFTFLYSKKLRQPQGKKYETEQFICDILYYPCKCFLGFMIFNPFLGCMDSLWQICHSDCTKSCYYP